MGHRMAANLEPHGIELPHLIMVEIARLAEKARGEIKSSAKPHLQQNRCCHDEIGLAAVVERDTHTRLLLEQQCFAYIESAKAGPLQPVHLAAEEVLRKDVAHITGIGLDQRPSGNFQLVIHQKNNL